LLVIGLNTNPLAAGIPGDPSTQVNAELAWFDSQLAAAQAAGQKVWVLMHVPPGANTQETAQNTSGATSPIQVDDETAEMMWVPNYQTAFLQILAKYPGVIALTLGAHTHMDEYRIMSPGNVLVQIPAISPIFGNNPAFKVFTFTEDTFTATDYTSFNYDLHALPAQFNSFYTFSSAYNLSGPLQITLQTLYPLLTTNSGKQSLYTYQYDSGNATTNSSTKASWNPINSVTWPIFDCGISPMNQQDYINCVNLY
jgi:hypothetical protein